MFRNNERFFKNIKPDFDLNSVPSLNVLSSQPLSFTVSSSYPTSAPNLPELEDEAKSLLTMKKIKTSISSTCIHQLEQEHTEEDRLHTISTKLKDLKLEKEEEESEEILSTIPSTPTSFSENNRIENSNLSPSPIPTITPLIFLSNPEEIIQRCEWIRNTSKRLHSDIVRVSNLMSAQDSTATSQQRDSKRKEPPLFRAVVIPFAYNEAQIMTLMASIKAVSNLHPDKRVRDACAEAQKENEQYKVQMYFRQDLYDAFKNVKTQEWHLLREDERRILEKIMLDFERNGLKISDLSIREKVTYKKKKIAELCLEFNRNLVEEKKNLVFTREQLRGMSDDFIDNLKRGENENEYLVPVKKSQINPILRSCQVEETRRLADIAITSKCMETNTPLFEKILKLRHEAATLLGYEDHASFVLETRIAKTKDSVQNFLNELQTHFTPLGEQELNAMKVVKKQHCIAETSEDTIIEPWNFSYLQNLVKKDKYNVSEVKLKVYFPIDHVLQKMFELLSTLYNISIEEHTDLQGKFWHEDVRLFSVYELEGRKDLLGHFFLDLFQREGKYSTNAAFPIQQTCLKPDGTRKVGVACLVSNFVKSNKGKTLLKHSEVKTIFHEFGHLCHNFLSKSKYGRFAGTNVEKDFSEFPSQLMEYWCYDEEALKWLSCHVETNEPMPDDVILQIQRGRMGSIGLHLLRQIHLATFDLQCHSAKKYPIHSADLYGKLRKQILMMDMIPGTNPAASFGHLMRTYDASYYGYLYSNVFAANVFEVFKEKGLFSREMGMNFRKVILEQGGMKDGMKLIKELLGREPKADAFVQYLYQLSQKTKLI